MSSAAEGSEDVNDFLQRIKELGDRRDHEDEERNRKLEEEILQGRKERQARRAERARSISPTKSSPANTPPASKVSLAMPTSSQSLSPTADPSKQPSCDTAIGDAMDRLTGTPAPPTNPKGDTLVGSGGRVSEPQSKKIDSIQASPSSAMPSRGLPLSWQRRPDSQSSDRPRSRPLSIVASENAARSPKEIHTPESPSASSTEPTISRDQIAQSLATKDPAWFRQTAEKGRGTPAYRKNQIEDNETANHGAGSTRVQMPGMSREGSGTEKASGGIGSPIPVTPAQRFSPPSLDAKSEIRGLAMSPSQGRISPDRLDRPISPTKGMGGFVQSAMMKRSDSVSKRWSVQSPPGLHRANSVASNQSAHDSPGNAPLRGTGYPSAGGSRPSRLSRDSSPHPTSRPSSSHSNKTITQDRTTTASSIRSSVTASTDSDGFVKPTLPTSRSDGLQEFKTGKGDEPTGPSRVAMTPPTSPSKTMDPRRWSPTKSSWLESALNKPDSPKPKSAPPPQQPAWMSEISKAKQKSSVDLGRGPTTGPKHEVNIGGLMKSPPPGGLAKPLNIGGLASAVSPSTLSNRATENISLKEGHDTPKPSTSEDTGISKLAAASTPLINAKPKPETPPKNDFRSALKPRQLPVDNGKTSEPEFKNVFGQLRRTKTQNYVAPDELKNNITRGKAALNVTGGPKKTERVDEFKDAILKKKDDFKKAQLEGKGVVRPAPGTNIETALPEALRKGKALGKSDLGTSTAEYNPIASKEDIASAQTQRKGIGGGKLADRFNPSLAGLLARGPPSMASETSRSSSPASQRQVSMSTPTTAPDVPEQGPQLIHVTKSRARGPRRKAPSTLPAAVDVAPKETITTPSTLTTDQVLAFKAVPDSQAREPLKSSKSNENPSTLRDTEKPISQPPSPQKLDVKRRSQFLREAPNKVTKVEPQLDPPKLPPPIKKANSAEIPVSPQPSRLDSTSTSNSPKVPVKSPSLAANALGSSTRNPVDISQISPSAMRPGQFPRTESKTNASTLSKPESTTPGTLNVQYSQTKGTPQPRTPSKDSGGSGSREPDPRSQQLSSGVNSPIKLTPRADERPAAVSPGFESTNKPRSNVGLGIHTSETSTSRPLPVPPTKTILPQPLKSSVEPSLMSPKRAAGGNLVPQASEATALISTFFGGKKATPYKYSTDTAGILAAKPYQNMNIKTLRSSLYQLAGDGKKHLVPSHQERILFEGNMYICLHVFGNAAGRKLTEVYHWVGDEVPRSLAEESKMFAQMEAKSCGGNLITVHQGKEPPEFIHALGGIVITRRGTSNKYDSLAPHILCGRKYFSQIAFDEVDFSVHSLCSGFPYLISTPSGKSYLWKGKGSGIEELSCARLIGMDFGLMGEIEEVRDGSEPASFLDIFGKAEIPKSADQWKMKPNYNKYCNRLFRANSTGKEQIVEISPFSQADLATSNIYVLDAFFEIYIIVGADAQSQYPAFRYALEFAEEYGILAASIEDRPLIPVSTVVIEGTPRDMRSVFRKWREGLTPTRTQPATTGLQRGRSLRVVPLNAAIAATR